ncbi:microtubule-associated protein 1S isoform X1 [Peromyscus californicus insignis]|uniref:microtubule-associated protein 1S isoform X1 n=2 Tax=Peromyscus californicus insignis TaxID=564181 RepID=UPI0022A6A51B|nr:microtubule-associated protein 1S isoform X1 [Peromyscus californicus insignis]
MAAVMAAPEAVAAPSSLLLLVVGGECGCPGLLAYVLEELERGVRSWEDVDPTICSLDEQLKAFVSRHSATFSSIVKGQRSLHHRGETLETLVLLNPSDKSLCDELRNLLMDPAPHKLLVLAGPCLEETGELLLQTGGFSAQHFLQVLEDKEVQDALASAPTAPPALTVSCPTFGDWAQLGPLPGLRLRLNPPARLPPSEGLRAFLEYVAESLELPSPFELLEPPAAGGFLRLARPCCYVFPGGLGDAAFFAVNGFTVLVNGGSNPKSSFWKLVRHLDRVDAVLVTHAGADSLPGLNSLLRRKLAEREAAAGPQGEREERLRRLLSPALGVVFLNAREAASRLRGGEDEAVCARGLLRSLGIAPLPLQRGSQPAQPTVLFEKLGVGRLELFVLHPPPGDPAAPACALLVWQPAAPSDKVVRVLFPGRTPPARLLDGLQRLQHLPCLRRPVVTARDLDAPARADSQDSLASRDSSRKEQLRSAAAGSSASRSTVRKEPAAPVRDLKKDPRPGPARPAGRDTRRSGPAAANAKPRTAQNGPRAPVPAGPPAAYVPKCPGEAGSSMEPERPPAPSPPRSPAPSPPPPAPGSSPERLSLSPLRPEPAPDASPSATTPTATTPTLTTPSLPAELGSPHSTEVDESLSVSFEQVLPAGDAGLSLPLRLARRSTSPHDVDLCLVSPCEFAHRKPPPPASPGSSDSSARSQERPPETPPTSVSGSLPTLSDSDPVPVADSDDEAGSESAARDPLPTPRVPPPLPDAPGICMVDPEALPPRARQPPNPASASRGRKAPVRPSSASATPRAASLAVKTKGPAGDRARPLSARSEPADKPGRVPLTRKPSVPKTVSKVAPATRLSSGPNSRLVPPAAGSPVYLDLAYLPGGGAGRLDQDFFLRVRALCYVISGQGQRQEEGLRAVLDALLAGKQRWDLDLQVTLIPTFDSAVMHRWYEETHEQHQALGIRVLGSGSMVSMQDEAFPACKVEF